MSASDAKVVTVELLEPAASSLSKASEQAVISGQDIAMNLEALANQAVGSGGSGWPKDFVSLNKVSNSVVWLRTVKPGEKVQVNFSYKVTWPSDKNIKIT